MPRGLSEGIQELGEALLSRLWTLAESTHDHGRDVVRNSCADPSRLQQRRRLVDVLHQNGGDGAPLERKLARQQLIAQHPQRVDVTPMIGLVARRGFWRDVCRRSEDATALGGRWTDAVEHACNAEVDQLDEVVVSAASNEVDVLGLDVPRSSDGGPYASSSSASDRPSSNSITM